MARVARLFSRYFAFRGGLSAPERRYPLGLSAVFSGLKIEGSFNQIRAPALSNPMLTSNGTRSYATLLEPINFKQVSLEQVKEEAEGLPQSKVFAVVHISGRQFKVTTNDLIVVNQLQSADIGEKINLEKVLLVGSENFTLIGNPILSKETVRVTATIVEHSRAAKVIVFKKKRRKNYKRKRGHRQDVTILRINDIDLMNTTCTSTL